MSIEIGYLSNVEDMYIQTSYVLTLKLTEPYYFVSSILFWLSPGLYDVSWQSALAAVFSLVKILRI